MICTPLPNAVEPVWAKQPTRLPWLMAYIEFPGMTAMGWKFIISCDGGSNSMRCVTLCLLNLCKSLTDESKAVRRTFYRYVFAHFE